MEIEIINFRINKGRKTATEIDSPHAGRVFAIKEIMIGSKSNRKPIPYDKSLIEDAEGRAEILKNGKLRII